MSGEAKPPTETQVPEEVSKLSMEEDDFVDPWNVVSKSATGLDYDKLISKFKLVCFFSLLKKYIHTYSQHFIVK